MLCFLGIDYVHADLISKAWSKENCVHIPSLSSGISLNIFHSCNKLIILIP